jgi:hypothetical protein|tara:strand:- start:190 stop:375 length:186 start_codon:yes stop_codon:yes gene_type:complete
MGKEWKKERDSVASRLLKTNWLQKRWLRGIWKLDKVRAIEKIDSWIKHLKEVRDEIIRMRS